MIYNFLIYVFLGLNAGMAIMAAWRHLGRIRGQIRHSKAIIVSSFPHINSIALKKILIHGDGPVPGWIFDSEYQKVQWLNQIIKEIWPYFTKSATELIRDYLSNHLEGYSYGSISNVIVRSLHLGGATPYIHGVKIKNSGLDKATLQVELDWIGDNTQKILLQVHSAMAPPRLVKVSKISFKSVVDVELKPLEARLPGFGAFVITMRKEPKMSMQVKTSGGNVPSAKGFEKSIKRILKSTFSDILSWPSRIVCPVHQGNYRFLNYNPSGFLEIVLMEGKDIPKVDLVSKTDPIVQFFIWNKMGSIKQSSTKMNNHSPVWNEVFLLDVEDVTNQVLTVKLMDDESFTKPRYVGSRKFKLDQLTENEPKDLWLQMVLNHGDENGSRGRGQLHLRLTYRPVPANIIEDVFGLLKSWWRMKKCDGIPYHIYKREYGTIFNLQDDEGNMELTAKKDMRQQVGRVIRLVKPFHKKSRV